MERRPAATLNYGAGDTLTSHRRESTVKCRPFPRVAVVHSRFSSQHGSVCVWNHACWTTSVMLAAPALRRAPNERSHGSPSCSLEDTSSRPSIHLAHESPSRLARSSATEKRSAWPHGLLPHSWLPCSCCLWIGG